MRVMVVHNFYIQPGGEDKSYRDEADLIEKNGNPVLRFERHNRDLQGKTIGSIVKQTLWSNEVVRDFYEAAQDFRPDVIHCHNTFPQIGIAPYSVAARLRIPVVETLHNYRWICPASSLLRDGEPCMQCVGKRWQWPSIQHACYQGKRSRTSIIAWRNFRYGGAPAGIVGVSRFIALTHKAKALFVQGGFPAERMVVKPNFIAEDPGVGGPRSQRVLFVGRLTHEKGVELILEIWAKHQIEFPLRIVGSGPLEQKVREAAAENPLIEWAGELPHEQVMAEMREARVLLMPSVGQETFGRTLIEAFATGTPVVAANHSSMAEVVEHGVTGLLFENASHLACAQALRELMSDRERWQAMSESARKVYQDNYSSEINYQQLVKIYQGVTASAD